MQENTEDNLNENINNQPEENTEVKGDSKKEDISLEEITKQLEDYKDKYLRKVAEFENYKKRTNEEKLSLIGYGAERFLMKLLPVVDDFERSLEHVDKAKDVNSIVEGIKLIYSKFIKLLTEEGVTPLDAAGKKFDVHYHDAILKQPAENVEPETVLQEVEKGYMYKEKVLRHSKVIISE